MLVCFRFVIPYIKPVKDAFILYETLLFWHITMLTVIIIDKWFTIFYGDNTTMVKISFGYELNHSYLALVKNGIIFSLRIIVA